MATATQTGEIPSQVFGVQDASADLSMLDKTGVRTARGLCQIVAGFGITPPEIEAIDVRVEGYDLWRTTLPRVAGICRIAMAPLKAGAVAVFPARLVAQLVDGFYGGSGDVRCERASLTGAEERITTRVGNQLAEIMTAAWADTAPVSASLVSIATSDDTPLYAPSEPLVVQSIALGGSLFAGTVVELLYPLAGIRGLQAPPGLQSAAREPGDAVWQDKLIDAVLQVRLPLRTIFARADLPLDELLNLQPGDVIPVCLPNLIPVTVGDRRFADAIVGETGGRVSIRIEAMQKGHSNND